MVLSTFVPLLISNMCNNKSKPDTRYSRLFARIYNPVMSRIESKFLRAKREQLLAALEGNILEVGAGTGINFDIYNPDKTQVFAFEPSGAMLALAEKKLETLEKRAHIQLIQAGVGDELPEGFLPKEGVDYAVFTLVLCTIPDPKAALAHVSKLLKPDGKIIILEHIRAKTGFARFMQAALNPIWKHAAEGCHLNRATDDLLKTLGFTLLEEHYFTKIVPFYMAVYKNKGEG